MSGRKIIVYIATSADGFIARRDGSVDWLNRPRTVGDYGMGAFFKTIDTILWGRKTYAVGLKFAKEGGGLGYGPEVKNYVFSHRPPKKQAPDVEFVSEPISEFAKRRHDAFAGDSHVIHALPCRHEQSLTVFGKAQIRRLLRELDRL